MKHLEHIGNHFIGIARDPQILLDFPRGCQRCPESHKDPQGKGRKEEKKYSVYVCIYIYCFPQGRGGPRKNNNFVVFFKTPPSPRPPIYGPSLTAGYGKLT